MGRFDGFDGLIAKHFGDAPPADDDLTEKLEAAGYHVKGLSGYDLANALAAVDWGKVQKPAPTLDQQKRMESCGIAVKVADPTPPAGTEADVDDPTKWGDFTNLRFHLGTPDVAIKGLEELADAEDYEPREMAKIQAKILRAATQKADDRPAMATCPNCDAKVPEGTKTCPECKKALTWQDGKPSLASDDDGDEASASKEIDTLGLRLKSYWSEKPSEDDLAQTIGSLVTVTKSIAHRHGADAGLGQTVHDLASTLGYDACVPTDSVKGSDVTLLQKHVADLSTELAVERVEKSGAATALTRATESLVAAQEEKRDLEARNAELEQQKADMLSELQAKSARLRDLEGRAERQLPADPLKMRKSVAIGTPGYRPVIEQGPTTMYEHLDDIRTRG